MGVRARVNWTANCPGDSRDGEWDCVVRKFWILGDRFDKVSWMSLIGSDTVLCVLKNYQIGSKVKIFRVITKD